ncbi:MAG: nucleotidyltransferase domain-containing protein [Verrucomicrobiales bacterium]|nr:nucleotidyltransferase domain-containing protein [Verrucomicrobiales bacterium]
MKLDLQTLLSNREDSVIFKCLSGSHAYALNTEDSDEDYKGIFILPVSAYLSLQSPPPQLADARNDVVYYTLLRFVELALSANPNIIELLYMPEDCIRKSTVFFEDLQRARNLFISKEAYQSHVGYAQAQIKKSRGQNKWVNHKQPKNSPEREAFCWFIDPQTSFSERMPMRPMKLTEVKIDLAECHAASLEHAVGMYRLYHYGSQARGVFRGGSVVCESIPVDDEKERFVGLLCYNEAAYERAVRDHRNYWDWRDHRNEKRWRSQEAGLMDYDAKNMMHTFRLLLSGEAILEKGAPKVRFEGEERDFLMSIRKGAFAYQDLLDQAEARIEKLAQLCEKCDLPQVVDRVKAEALLKRITAKWEQAYQL